MGKTVYGEVSSKYMARDSEKDSDYFAFNIPQSGDYKLTYANDDYAQSSRGLGFLVYNRYYENLNGVWGYQVGTTTIKPESKTLRLTKGVNYIKVAPAGIWPSEGATQGYHFKLVPVVNKTTISKVVAGKKCATVKYKKKVGTTKYQIRYSTKSSMKGAKTYNVRASKSSAKITKLKANKKYYFQVRVVKKMDGTEFYSGWSGKKATTVKGSSSTYRAGRI